MMAGPPNGRGGLIEKPKSVKAYFASLPKEQRPALQKLRQTTAAAAP